MPFYTWVVILTDKQFVWSTKQTTNFTKQKTVATAKIFCACYATHTLYSHIHRSLPLSLSLDSYIKYFCLTICHAV